MNNPLRMRTKTPGIDRHIGRRLRELRIMLGMTQRQLAEECDCIWQSIHGYEYGTTRIPSGKLFLFAEALGVEVNYFYESYGKDSARKLPPRRTMLLGLAQSFIGLPTQRQKESVLRLARALNDG